MMADCQLFTLEAVTTEKRAGSEAPLLTHSTVSILYCVTVPGFRRPAGPFCHTPVASVKATLAPAGSLDCCAVISQFAGTDTSLALFIFLIILHDPKPLLEAIWGALW